MNHFLRKLRQDRDDELWRGTRGHTAGGSNLLNVGADRLRNYPIATSGKSDLSVQTGQQRFQAIPAQGTWIVHRSGWHSMFHRRLSDTPIKAIDSCGRDPPSDNLYFRHRDQCAG
jgi:hypothetical protein